MYAGDYEEVDLDHLGHDVVVPELPEEADVSEWASAYVIADNLRLPPGLVNEADDPEGEVEVNFCLPCVYGSLAEPIMAKRGAEDAAEGEPSAKKQRGPEEEEDDEDDDDKVNHNELTRRSSASLAYLRDFMRKVIVDNGPQQAIELIHQLYDERIRATTYWQELDENGKAVEYIPNPAWTRTMIKDHLLYHDMSLSRIFAKRVVQATYLRIFELAQARLHDRRTGIVDIKAADFVLKVCGLILKLSAS